jgi:hypothetical protein
MKSFFIGNNTWRGLFLMIMSAFFIVFTSACGTQPAPVPPSLAPAAPVATVLTTSLTHSPVGTVDMSWDANSYKLTVKVALTGLAPNSTHPEHIHAGTCASDPMGAILYTLNPLKSDAKGDATSETVLSNVTHGIPTQGWYVNVHNGPTLDAPNGGDPIGCANITGGTSAPVHAIFMGGMGPDESAHGSAQINITGDKMTIDVKLSGLKPNSSHIAHIHSGSCAAQGNVIYPLQLIKADAQGNATSSTTVTITNPQQLATSHMYVNVHEAGTMDGMSTQQGFDPVACGDIVF